MARARVTKTRVAIVGAGRLARALLPVLGPAGYRVITVAARNGARARSAARLARGARATTRLASALDRAELVLLAVPDRAIPEVADLLAATEDVRFSELTVLHHAGAWGAELLDPLARRGAATGVLHPLQCLGSAALAPRLLAGSVARIEGDRRALGTARRLARALGLRPVVLPAASPDSRMDYHAAAAVVANDWVALLDLGRELLRRAGLADRVALEALLALAHGTFVHYREAGEAAAATGPVSRGDVETLGRHLERLASLDGGHEVHRLLSLRLARLARRRGRPALAEAVERALDPGLRGDSGV